MLKINCIKQQRKKKLLLDITSISKLVPRKRQDGATSSLINSSFDSNRKLLECGHLCSTWMHLINNNKKKNTIFLCVFDVSLTNQSNVRENWLILFFGWCTCASLSKSPF